MVAGYAIGGGHVLHLVCDLTIAADNARFGQVGPRVGSFDGGFGASLLASLVGPKKAKEIWLLCRQYDAAAGAARWASSTPSCRSTELEDETVAWCREMLALSPFALRLLKASFNAGEDGLAGHPAARPRREPPLLRQRGGPGGPQRLPREAPPGLLALPAGGPEPIAASGAHLGDGRPRAHAAGCGRAGARRHLARARRRHTSTRWRSSRRCSGRSSSRSARTSPTTTPTRAAAPTPRTASDRSA